MSGPVRIVLASHNAGKLREMSALLAPLGVELLPQASLGIGEADEPHDTFVENALAKARHACLASGLPALADDSGISVNALQGEPGVYSARYAQRAGGDKGDAANNQHLLQRMRGLADRSAFYYCVLALVRWPGDPCPLLSEAAWHGEVVETPRGDNGFGYDPYFLLPELGRTAAELAPDEKNRLSHRGRAMAGLLARLPGSGLLAPR
ncbi:MAG: RdgB/HAM1 family non-canonical purine NTP pyrophosphatase [Burkholderiaceae bacterium]